MPNLAGASRNDLILTSRLSGESFDRMRMESDGQIFLGNGLAQPESVNYVSNSGFISPPGTSYAMWAGPAVWFGANYEISMRFQIDRTAYVGAAIVGCDTASGNIEVSISKIAQRTANSFSGYKIGGSGIIACPAPGGFVFTEQIRVPFTQTLVLPPGQYVVTLWCDNITAKFNNALSTPIRGSGQALSTGTSYAAGMPDVSSLQYSGRVCMILLEELGPSIGSMVLLGDSITQAELWYGPATAISDRLYYPIINKGNPGEQTAAMLARVNTDVVALAPRACVVLGGSNDVGNGTSSATTIANLRSIYNTLIASNIRVIAGTVPPRDNTSVGDRLTAAQRTALQEINNWIRLQRDVTVCDWSVPLSTGDGYTPNSAYFTDHVHPNTTGAKIMATVLARVL